MRKQYVIAALGRSCFYAKPTEQEISLGEMLGNKLEYMRFFQRPTYFDSHGEAVGVISSKEFEEVLKKYDCEIVEVYVGDGIERE